MMDQAFKQKWIEALESGEFKQGRQRLYSSDGYCCLGVACAVAGATFKKINEVSNNEAFLDGDQISDDGIILATEFARRAGLSDDDQKTLYHMNDGYMPDDREGHIKRHSFVEIAQHLREKM